MLKKVHLRLTLLCTAVIGAILVAITFVYLYVSETNMKTNHFTSFQNDAKNILNSLENQPYISDQYLASLEAGDRYLVFVEDNGSLLLYGTIIESEERFALWDEVRSYYEIQYTSESPETASSPGHREFTYTSEARYATGSDYYACFATLAGAQGSLNVCLLAPVSSFYGQITRQRVLFIAVDLTALAILYLFFYYLTGYLLRPVVENQQKQTLFVAAASHELRTPLAVILSSASLIPHASEEEQQQFLNTITEGGNVMKRLLSEMLTLAGFDSGKTELQKEDTELDTLILNCVETFEPLAREKNIALKASLPEDPLPLCRLDRHKMEQVLSVLLHNAVSYTETGGSITVSVRYAKKRFQISVADTGIGISDEDKKRIFERFYRADKARHTKEHFGLGLSIASSIVKAHGGKLRVEDTPGGGSTFIVEL